MAMGIPYISVYDREGRLFVWLRLYDAIHGRPQTILLHPDQEAQVAFDLLFFYPLGVLKGKAADLSSEIIQKQTEVFVEGSKKYTFVLRTKNVKFDCEMLGKS